MRRPFVFHPGGNPQQGANHKTVTIRFGGQSIRITCDNREQAENIGRGLNGVFNRYIESQPPTTTP